MDVGAQLRRAREKRNLSLFDLSQITKIRVPLLKALENNETLTVSGDFYTRGLLRAYAAAVGLNPEEIVCVGLAQEAENQLGLMGGGRQAEERKAGQGRAEGQRAPRARVLLGAGIAAVTRILYVLWFGRAGTTSIPASPLDSSKPRCHRWNRKPLIGAGAGAMTAYWRRAVTRYWRAVRDAFTPHAVGVFFRRLFFCVAIAGCLSRLS
jgi:transcriptional regulator with XRE-family HTH domain